jgi:hypothetical protein
VWRTRTRSRLAGARQSRLELAVEQESAASSLNDVSTSRCRPRAVLTRSCTQEEKASIRHTVWAEGPWTVVTASACYSAVHTGRVDESPSAPV